MLVASIYDKPRRKLMLSFIVLWISISYRIRYDHGPTSPYLLMSGVQLFPFEILSLTIFGITKIIFWIIKKNNMRKNNEFSMSNFQLTKNKILQIESTLLTILLFLSSILYNFYFYILKSM